MRNVIVFITVLVLFVSASACNVISPASSTISESDITPSDFPGPTNTPLPTPAETVGDKISQCKAYDVSDIKASPESYIGKYMTVTGVLKDIVSGENQYQFLIAESDDMSKLWELYIEYSQCPESFEVPEIGDQLTGYGEFFNVTEWLWSETAYEPVCKIYCFDGGVGQ